MTHVAHAAQGLDEEATRAQRNGANEMKESQPSKERGATRTLTRRPLAPRLIGVDELE